MQFVCFLSAINLLVSAYRLQNVCRFHMFCRSRSADILQIFCRHSADILQMICRESVDNLKTTCRSATDQLTDLLQTINRSASFLPVPRPIPAIQVKGGGLELSVIARRPRVKLPKSPSSARKSPRQLLDENLLFAARIMEYFRWISYIIIYMTLPNN